MLFIRWPRGRGSPHAHVYMSRDKQSRFTPAWNWSPCESEQLQELGNYYCDDQAGCTRSASTGSVIPCFLSFCLASWMCTSAKLFSAVLVYPYHAVFHISGAEGSTGTWITLLLEVPSRAISSSLYLSIPQMDKGQEEMQVVLLLCLGVPVLLLELFMSKLVDN